MRWELGLCPPSQVQTLATWCCALWKAMLFNSLASAISTGAQPVLIRGSLDKCHICFTCDHRPDPSLEMLFPCFCDIDYMAKSDSQAQTMQPLALAPSS